MNRVALLIILFAGGIAYAFEQQPMTTKEKELRYNIRTTKQVVGQLQYEWKKMPQREKKGVWGPKNRRLLKDFEQKIRMWETQLFNRYGVNVAEKEG